MKRQSFYIIGVLLLCSSLLSGCGTMTAWFGRGKGNQSIHHVDESAGHYLRAAESASAPQHQAYQLMAARRLLQDRMAPQARQVLNKVSTQNMPQELVMQRYLLVARLQLISNRPKKTLAMLSHVPEKDMSLSNRVDLHELLAMAYLRVGNVVSSAQQRTELSPLLSDDEQRDHNDQLIWEGLQHLHPATLSAYLKQPQSDVMRGWLSLAYITQQPPSHSQAFVQQLQKWRREYPGHPANTILPESLAIDTTHVPKQPRQVALLLPMHGKLSASGQAIRNGFLAAYYYAKQQGERTPTITVIDTSQQDIASAYQNATSHGADFIVGPLTKNNLASVANMGTLPVPTLALNTLDDYRSASTGNLYQFGLSPRDEAVQTAERAWIDDHKRAMIIAPAGDWGQGIATAFADRWESLGGQVVVNWSYPHQRDLSTSLRHLLSIDQSQERADSLKETLQEKFKFVPQRREDIDVIFLAALPAQARQIRPLLKYYYAGSIPIYATSTIYQGTPLPSVDNDLNGIQFCDMPWVLNTPSQLPKDLRETRTKITSLWPSSYRRHAKLYGLGIDAYNLITQLNRLVIFPQLDIAGATGLLSLDQYHHIYRELEWAKMRGGVPHVLQSL